MTRVIVIRHGQSEGNLNEEFHGIYNSDITELGHKQAEETAKFLDDYKIDKIYSSDIRRAFSTAKHTADRKGLDIITDEGFREISAGEWEKMKFADIANKYPETFKIWYENIGECVLPGGESVKSLYERAKAAFEKVVAENDGKTIMIATHATTIRALSCLWKGASLSEMKNINWVTNASVTIIDCKGVGTYKTVLYNYSEHLEKKGLFSKLPKKI